MISIIIDIVLYTASAIAVIVCFVSHFKECKNYKKGR